MDDEDDYGPFECERCLWAFRGLTNLHHHRRRCRGQGESDREYLNHYLEAQYNINLLAQLVDDEDEIHNEDYIVFEASDDETSNLNSEHQDENKENYMNRPSAVDGVGENGDAIAEKEENNADTKDLGITSAVDGVGENGDAIAEKEENNTDTEDPEGTADA